MRCGRLRRAPALLVFLFGMPLLELELSAGLSPDSLMAGPGTFTLGVEPSALGEWALATQPGPARPTASHIRPGLEPLPAVRLRNEEEPFDRMFVRGEAIIGGIEVASLVLLSALPRSVTKWDEHPFEKAGQNLKRAWSEPPVWDQDVPFHNYVGHPYAGSVYYNMVRSQGATPLQSFLFSSLQSFLFEYVVEAVAEQPSKQDLLITSTVGSLLGELLHRWTLRLMEKERLTFLDKVVLLVINPSFVVNNGFSPPRRSRGL